MLTERTLRALVVTGAVGIVLSWFALPWFVVDGESLVGSEAFDDDRFSLLGFATSWGELGVLGAGLAGISALVGDRFGQWLSFAAFAPLFVTGKYSLFTLPAGLPESAGRGWAIWLALVLSLGMTLAAFDLEVLGERQEEEPRKRCPDCAEVVLPEASVCKHCGYEFAFSVDCLAAEAMAFLVVDLPADPFVFIDEAGLDHGPFRGGLFATLEDGTMVCSGHGGSPLYLRVTAVDGDWITTLDGTGGAFRYRIVPLTIDTRGEVTLKPPKEC